MEKLKKKLTKSIYEKNEIDANKGLTKGCFFSAIALLVVWIFYLTHLFSVYGKTIIFVNIAFPIIIVILGSSIFYTKTRFIESPKFKYFIIIEFSLATFAVNVLLPKHGILMWAACLIVVNHYFSPKALLFSFVMISVMMLIALYAGMIVGEWDPGLLNGAYYIELHGEKINVDTATIKDRLEYLEFLYNQGDNRFLKAFLYYYLPREIILAVIANIGYGLSKRTMNLLVMESESASEKEKMQYELNVSRAIQYGVLPKEIDNGDYVFGLMDAAKEIGGDFYDYFYVDDSHMAFVVGDVSGKGIPAALFMMKTESLIQSLATALRQNTANIMKRCNISLCTNNQANMFVTCWLGILNLNTGELKYTNAGHNSPILFQDGNVKLLNDKPGVVLGAFEDIEYKEHKIKLKNGDKILLYTDGVTEAHNISNYLYGEERLLAFSKNNKNHNPKSFVLGLKKDIDAFRGDALQFDDITILMYQFNQVDDFTESRIFVADVKELDNLFEYSSSLLRTLEFSNRDIIMINTALEEVFVNVANYAYEEKGTVEITLSKSKDKVSFIFKDSGKPFNPLDRVDPNINASSDERDIGGLGIYMVKKIMDDVSYEYADNHNILTLVKFKKTL